MAQFVSYIDPESVMGFQFSLLMASGRARRHRHVVGTMLARLILHPAHELTRSFIGAPAAASI